MARATDDSMHQNVNCACAQFKAFAKPSNAQSILSSCGKISNDAKTIIFSNPQSFNLASYSKSFRTKANKNDF